MLVVYVFLSVAVAFYVCYFVIAKITYGIAVKNNKKKLISQVKDKVSELDSKMTYVTYRGYNIPMTVLEKRTMWDNMTRDAKNMALADFKQALKFGRIKEYKTK